MNCFRWFHRSFARAPKLKLVNSNKVMCCKSKEKWNTSRPENGTLENEASKTENILLRKLMEEMTDKNLILNEDNRLLQKKINHVNKSSYNTPATEHQNPAGNWGISNM